MKAMTATKVKDLMTSTVETLRMGDTLELAKATLKLKRIRHLPVVDADQKLVGLVTHRDILGAWISHHNPIDETPDQAASEVPVDMMMNKEVTSVSPNTPAKEAATLLQSHKYGCLPVVEDGVLVGIVTEADFVKLAVKFLECEPE